MLNEKLIYLFFGLLAQLAEQLTLNQWVEGSSPPQPIGCQTHEEKNVGVKTLALCQIVLFKQNLYKKKDFGSSFFVIL